MRIISSKEKFIGKISCECETEFEFEASDMMVKGHYVNTFLVKCPVCAKEHNYTENMTSENEHEVLSYINNCKSCSDCKFMSVVEDGYSSYTVTSIEIDCKLNLNKELPLFGMEDRREKESVYAFAEKCSKYKVGTRYHKEVEESKEDAVIRWNLANQ